MTTRNLWVLILSCALAVTTHVAAGMQPDPLHSMLMEILSGLTGAVVIIITIGWVGGFLASTVLAMTGNLEDCRRRWRSR
jgi:type IV secretory pathway VirB2 component (pilin)